MTHEEKVLATLRIVVTYILDAATVAKRAGPWGAPSGVIYAALSAHGMTLNAYETIIAYLVDTGKITVKNHCVCLA